MRAWRMYDFGDFRLDEVPDPEPQPGWAVCKVRRVQASVTDVQRGFGVPTMNIAGLRRQLDKYAPATLLGHEFSAEVVAIGEGVKDLSVGDIVCTSGHAPCGQCAWCKAGRDSWCSNKLNVGIDTPGAFAELVPVPAKALLKMPSTLDDASVTCLQCLSSTVAAMRDANIRTGETVAITGQGVMGLYALQAARFSGADEVFVTDVREEALALSERFQADAAINARHEDPVERIRALTDGRGVDVVFECAGGNADEGLSGHTTLHQAFEMVRLGGRVMQVSGLVGEVRADPEKMRARGIKWIYLEGHGNYTLRTGLKWVTSGRMDVRSLVSHEVRGIEKFMEAIEITQHKEKYKATNPCQIVLVG